MAKFLKYYTEENARHQEVQAVNWTLQQCHDGTDALCDAFQLPRIPVFLAGTKKNKSWYSTEFKQIHYHPSMLNPLTVAHEFAHYRDHMFRLAERDEKNSKIKLLSVAQPLRFMVLARIDTKTRWHGVRHLQYTDQAVAVLQKLPFYVPFRVTRMEAIVAGAFQYYTTNLNPVEAAFNALPEVLHCPKCSCDKVKAQFGVRVMARDPATNQPIKIVRQSYCRGCR